MTSENKQSKMLGLSLQSVETELTFNKASSSL